MVYGGGGWVGRPLNIKNRAGSLTGELPVTHRSRETPAGGKDVTKDTGLDGAVGLFDPDNHKAMAASCPPSPLQLSCTWRFMLGSCMTNTARVGM